MKFAVEVEYDAARHEPSEIIAATMRTLGSLRPVGITNIVSVSRVPDRTPIQDNCEMSLAPVEAILPHSNPVESAGPPLFIKIVGGGNYGVSMIVETKCGRTLGEACLDYFGRRLMLLYFDPEADDPILTHTVVADVTRVRDAPGEEGDDGAEAGTEEA